MKKRTWTYREFRSISISIPAPILVLFTLWVAVSLSEVDADVGNWPKWRGPGDNGSTAAGSYPVKWDPEKVLWQGPLPGKGCSTPIVWDQRIYLTAPADGQDAVLAFDWSGNRLWQRALGPEDGGKHRNGSGSNPSPVTDGAGVFVSFKSGDFAALELDGSVRWQMNLVEKFGPYNLYWDYGTSPVLTEQSVILAKMHEGESWLAAFDKATGKMRWKVPRNYETPTEGDQAYSTPIVFSHRGKEAVLVWGAQHLTAHDAGDGGLLWSCGGFNPQSKGFWPAVASPVIAGDIVVVPFGRADRRQPRLHGVKLGGSGDVTLKNRVWKREDVGTFVPTPAEYQGRVYILSDRGQVDCLDPATGNTLWSGAFPRARASFYGSPLIAGEHLYAAREDGVIFVAGVKDKFEVLAEIDMGERLIASPVAVSNRLLIRGERHLFCVAGSGQETKPSAEGGKKDVEEEAAYRRAIQARAEKIVAKLGIGDRSKAVRVRDLIAEQYRSLRDIHDARDAAIQAARAKATNPEAKEAVVKAAREDANAKQSELHRRYLEKLSAELKPEQVDKVKDGMTYGVVQVTYRNYLKMLPKLKDEERAQIMAYLVEAREIAMDGGSSEEKHAVFRKYKGKINNYLSKAGYDLKKASKRLR